MKFSITRTSLHRNENPLHNYAKVNDEEFRCYIENNHWFIDIDDLTQLIRLSHVTDCELAIESFPDENQTLEVIDDWRE